VEPSGQPPLVLLGASTGGPEALAAVLTHLQPGFSGAVLIAQHIAPEFAPGLVDWLSARCRLPVRAAREGEPPARGTVLLAATNDHLEIAADLTLHYSVSPANYAYRPSADVLFISGGAVWPRTGIAVLLTGMGTDGAEGMSRLRSMGWHTIAQDESTCVVYGMPRAAVERHAAVETLPLSLIGPTIAAKVHSNLMGRDKH
jgi:two-component system response regulator WspF